VAAPSTRPRTPPSSARAETIVKHGLYEIATGGWRPGERLPSLREARRLWSANHLTVLRAYRRLVGLGLVRNVPRSGFFVADTTEVGRLARHRADLDRVYGRLRGAIAGKGISVVGAFRYLAQLAEARARDAPECAFAECTLFQAQGHAREVAERLRVPCLPLTTAAIAEDGMPAHVQTLFTTSFHIAELRRRARPPGLAVVDVPIEFSVGMAARLAATAATVRILATDGETARHAARDARRRVRGVRFEAARAAVKDVEREVDRALATRRAVLLSPSLWSALADERRGDPLLLPFEYRIREASWPRLADAIGLPLGSLG
jgi:DNA-binding transcriptional regulator YhcF (GntR family)